MATLVEKIIGTGGDYATWDDFIAACPANLVAIDQQWTVRFKNQTHSSATGFAFVTGRTTSATCYFHFTAEVGGAWCDHADVRTLPFAPGGYGAALVTTGSSLGLQINVSYTKVSRLRISNQVSGSGAYVTLRVQSSATNCDVNQVIADGFCQSSSISGVANVSGSTNYIRNSLIVQRSSNVATLILNVSSGARAVNVTGVALNVKINNGVAGSGYVNNVAMLNVIAGDPDTGTITKVNSFTDGTGSGWLAAPYSTATFESITPASPDFRLKAGSVLIDSGAVENLHGTHDATGMARPVGAGYDVGAWEYGVATAPEEPPADAAPVLEVPTGTATGSTTANGTVATSEAGGLLYRLANTSPTATAAAIKAANLTSVVEATGLQNVVFTGLPQSTTLYAHYVQVDNGNMTSNVVSSAAFTTSATPTGTGTFKTLKLANNTSTGWPSQTAVVWEWHQAGRIGTAATSVTYGSGALATDGTLTIAGCPLGAGYVLVVIRGSTIATDKPFYQSGTVA